MPNAAVGEDVEDQCTKCGIAWHTVVAKVEDRIVRVICKGCGSQHKYRSAPTTKTASPSTRKRAAAKKAAAPEPLVMPDFDPNKPPVPYSPRESFVPGDRINHVKFGLGIVRVVPSLGR